MGKMRNNDPVPKEFTLRLMLCCKDLVSMQHIVLFGVKSTVGLPNFRQRL